MAARQKYVMHEEEADLQELVGRSYKLIVGSRRLPCRAMNGGVSLFPPHAHAPGHVHEAEEEVIYCLEGRGEIMVESKPEPLRPGCFVVIPPNILHSINNTGEKTIKLIFLFSPPCKIGKYKDITSG